MQSRWLLPLLAILPLAATPAVAQGTVTVTHSYRGVTLPIYVDDLDVATVVGVPVPEPIRIQKVTVRVDIEYPEVGDLNVFLYSPEGTRTKLVERDCGSQGTLRLTTFDDAAPSKYSEFCPAEGGRTLRGDEPLSNSVGESGSGVWLLAVENNGSNDRLGWVLGFSVTITGESLTVPTFIADTVVNTSSLQSGPIAPGGMISIFGAGLGPNTEVQAPGTTLPTTLGGVTVQIGDVTAVPIRSVSKYRLDVQVPSTLGSGGSAPIIVKYQNATSSTVYVDVVGAAPGLVTVGPAGRGTIVAFNADGSRNTESATAQPGSLVKVIATGLGITLPTISSGTPAPSPAPPVWNGVTASVAGIPAEVTEAVLQTGTAGLYAVTIRVPDVAPAGGVSVKLSSVGSSSQNGALIWVR